MEYQMRFSDLDVMTSALPYMPVFEKVRILWEVYPAFMRGSLMVAQSTFVDKEKLRDQQMAWVMKALQEIHTKVVALEQRPAGGGQSKKARAMAAQAGAAAATVADAAGQNNVDPSKRAELKQRAAANKTGGSQQQQPGQQIPQPASSGLGIPRWVWGIGMYVFIQWVFSS